MEKNSPGQFCFRSVKQGHMHNELILMSFDLYGVRHSPHFTHSNTRPGGCLINPQEFWTRVSNLLGGLGVSGRLSSEDDRYLKFHWPFTAKLTVRTDNPRRNQMQQTGYVRFKIESKPAPHAFPIPNKFDVSARKL